MNRFLDFQFQQKHRFYTKIMIITSLLGNILKKLVSRWVKNSQIWQKSEGLPGMNFIDMTGGSF